MKKITLLAGALLVSLASYAQDTVADVLTQTNPADLDLSISANSTITSRSANAVVATYDVRADYEAAVASATETYLEDFAGGPVDISACDAVISSAGGTCYAAGEIIENIEVTIGAINDGTVTVYVPDGAFGNAGAIVGANTFADFTILNFLEAGTNAVGFNVHALTTGGDIEVRVLGADGLIEAFSVSSPGGAEAFFGVVADEDIVSIELQDLTDANAELVGMLTYSTTVLGVNDSVLSGVSIFPNPTSEVLNIKVPSTIEVTSITLYDVLGKATNVSLSNDQINVSGLARGIYILNVNTTAGTLTEKVIIE
jgi:hypothetical protein